MGRKFEKVCRKRDALAHVSEIVDANLRKLDTNLRAWNADLRNGNTSLTACDAHLSTWDAILGTRGRKVDNNECDSETVARESALRFVTENFTGRLLGMCRKAASRKRNTFEPQQL